VGVTPEGDNGPKGVSTTLKIGYQLRRTERKETKTTQKRKSDYAHHFDTLSGQVGYYASVCVTGEGDRGKKGTENFLDYPIK